MASYLLVQAYKTPPSMDNYRYYTMGGGGKSIEIRYYFEKYRAACYIRGLVVLSGLIWSKLNVKLNKTKAHYLVFDLAAYHLALFLGPTG